MKNLIKTYLLLGILTGLLIIIGSVIAGQFGIIIALLISFFLNFFSYWYSDKIVLSMYKAKPLENTNSLYEILKKLSVKAKIPTPKLYLIESKEPNAFATGRNHKHSAVAVSSGLIESLSNEEIEAVLAHEISHIKNNDILIGSLVAVVASAIMHLASMGKFALLFGGIGRDDNKHSNVFSTILLLVLAPIVAILIQFAISRSREFLADRGSKEILGTPTPLVNALRKIERASIKVQKSFVSPQTAHMFIFNALDSKDFLRLFSTHPSLEKRIENLLYEI